MMEQLPVVSGGGRDKNKQSQLPPPETPPPPPQKCPRCDSINTKFCYYNNYSVTQPRYFCKSCKRYWTHGGSLRNVPIGGGCRKGKRPKHQVLPTRPIHSAPAVPSVGPFYGGYLSSMAAFHSLNPSISQPLNNPSTLINFEGVGSSSNFSQLQIPILQGGNREVESGVYTVEEEGLIQTRICMSSSANSHHHDWSQTFMTTNANLGGAHHDDTDHSDEPTPNGSAGSPSSLIPNHHHQLPHLPGFGPHLP